MAEEALLRIYRGDNEKGEMVDYKIPVAPGMVVLDAVHAVLTTIYWSEGIPKETVRRGIEGSISFGVYARALGPGVGTRRGSRSALRG